MMENKIIVRGARENNLQGIDVDLPRNKLIVFTGVSGSGKSSLAFDTIYAEGQRRYIESLPAYARQFLGQLDKPDVEYIEGLSPAVSIDQRGVSKNPRSTVGTITEIYDYLRLLYARVGQPHCPNCGRAISPQSIDQIIDSIYADAEGNAVMLLAPLVRGRKGQFQKLFKEIMASGYMRVRVDGEIRRIDDGPIELGRYEKHTIEVVVDKVRVLERNRQRLAESLETTMHLSKGIVLVVGENEEKLYSQHLACIECGISFSELSPRLFSFNSPYGACPHCTGLGTTTSLDRSLVVPDPNLSVAEGALAPWGKPIFNSFRYHFSESLFWRSLVNFASLHHLDLKCPWRLLSPREQDLILFGTAGPDAYDRAVEASLEAEWSEEKAMVAEEGPDDEVGLYDGSAVRPVYSWSTAESQQPNPADARKTVFSGAIYMLERRYRETESEWARKEISRYMTERLCKVCHGARLKPEACAVTVDGFNLPSLTSMSVLAMRSWLDELSLSERDRFVAKDIIKELRARLGFLAEVGLDYLTVDRTAGTLSGGEAQRIRLATQVGSKLVGVLYVLDEPSIGLHQRDNQRLLDALCSLRDLGNTLIVVEHDEDTIRAADEVVDIGPGAGVHGGRIVAQGTAEQIAACPESLTGAYLAHRLTIPMPAQRRPVGEGWLRLKGCAQNNLKHIDVDFPLGVMTTVTGVSGSGKSTLVNEILRKALQIHLKTGSEQPGLFDSLEGTELIDKVVVIDQDPIGRTPRSNPATYTELFTPLRDLFAKTPDARLRGYKPGRFSFNLKGGRCEACQGQGILKIEMHFLSDVFVPCEVCQGKRFNRETLEVRYKGKNIAEVLDMTVEEALHFFENVPRLANKLQTLYDVGLGYVCLGQSATTLSGGEAQRVKLATELSRRATGRTVYILDEPTTGLHFADVAKLLSVLQRLVEGGNTVIIIEHNLDVIRASDWIIDLGPEGGDRGGEVIVCGTPEQVAQCERSYTGQWI